MRFCLLLAFLVFPLAVLAIDRVEMLALRSAEVTGLIEKGQKLGNGGNVREALDCFLRAIHLDSCNIRARYYCGVAYLRLGEYFAAVSEYDRIQEIVMYYQRVEKRSHLDVTEKLNLAKKAKLLLEQQFRSESAKQNDNDDIPLLPPEERS